MAQDRLYTTADLELVKQNLSAILTRDSKDVGEMIRKSYSDEIRPLQSIFAEAGNMLANRQWAAAILAQLPLVSWVERNDGEMHVSSKSEASLRFLGVSPPSDDSKNEHAVMDFKESLANLLLRKMSRNDRQRYLPMLRWVPYENAPDEGVRGQPLSSEIAFGHNLGFLEHHLGRCEHELEQAWCQTNHWPKSETLPNPIIREISKKALNNVKAMLDGWFDEDAKEDGVSGSLIALTMANLAANRALLEYAGLDVRGSEAEKMVVEFLQALNLQGLKEVPEEMDKMTARQGVGTLRETLYSWFGSQGKAISADGYFSRPIANGELDVVVSWSLQVQESYIAGRGNRGDLKEAWAIHGSASHLFIFALGIIAAYYAKTKVPNEFTGKKNATHSVFPSRNMIAAGEAEAPSTHALKLLEQAYGLMFFGNTGWFLRADSVQARASINSTRRLHYQQLIFHAVKNRSSWQLLSLHRRLDEMRSRQATPQENPTT
ncbi:hypothetical protein [Pseudomonas hunanensis]|uniref:hypothetical protein n=1 Tax=Pseudomonas hunanensis TaxID=1247546 RepID=UPI0030D813A0